jgi:hypothetical protein
MANRFRTNILSLSGVDITLSPSDTTNYFRHDGTFSNPIAGHQHNYVTGITVSGSSPQTGLINITGIGSINIILSGNSIVCSGGAGGAGEANTASNLGAGSGLFSQKSAIDLQFKSLIGGSGIQITGGANDLTLVVTGIGAGTTETASNLGAGLGIFSGKVINDLQFYSLTGVSGVNVSRSGNQIAINVSNDIGESQGYNFGFKKVTADVSSSSSTVGNITNLSFPVISGDIYGFQAMIGFYTSHATCGLSLAVDGPTGAGSTGVWSSEIMLLNTQGTDSIQSMNRNSFPTANRLHTTASVNTSGAASIPLIARIQGYWIPNSTGIIQLQFAPEVNGNTGVILRGSWLKWF